jgi:phage tail tape-measure protein
MQKSHGLGGQVGDRVGKKVGDWVGNWVGETDGDSDGDCDGEELTANRQRTLEPPSRKPAMTGSEPVTKPDTNPINPTSRQFLRR